MPWGPLLIGLLAQSSIVNPGAGNWFTYACSAKASGSAITATYQPNPYPSLGCQLTTPQNWSNDAFTFQLTNPGASPVTVFVRIDDSLTATGTTDSETYSIDAAAGSTQSCVCSLLGSAMSYGMFDLPPSPLGTTLTSYNSANAANIVRWQIFLQSPTTATQLVISNVKVQPDNRLVNTVDAFGQFTGANWNTKVSSIAQLQQVGSNDPQSWTTIPSLDSYGGWQAGPQLTASGRFRMQDVNGKWYFVTPSGHLFYSIGCNTVAFTGATIVTNRSAMFGGLPATTGAPTSSFYGQTSNIYMGPLTGQTATTFDYFEANRYLKYGTGWGASSATSAVNRLHAWGFNTLGNWTDPNVIVLKKMPYVATVQVNASIPSINTGPYPMPDVFNPSFPATVTQKLKAQAAGAIGDPWCLGWFIDSELSWSGSAGTGEENGRYGLAYGALAAPAGTPAKYELLGELENKYGTITALNAQWGSNFASWAAMNAPITTFPASVSARQPDLLVFCQAYTYKYFEIINSSLKALDPGALYLGCRFTNVVTTEAEHAAGLFCDVISLNIYAPSIDPADWSWLSTLGRPLIIGEFDFGSTDDGMFSGGLAPTSSQSARAAAYQAYLQSVLTNSVIVGCHWFEYEDEPTLGRAQDGENYNIGLVSVADKPYPELIQAAMTTNLAAYTTRYGTAPAAKAP